MNAKDPVDLKAINESNREYAEILAKETGNIAIEKYELDLRSKRSLRGLGAFKEELGPFYCRHEHCPLLADFSVNDELLCSLHAVVAMVDEILIEEL